MSSHIPENDVSQPINIALYGRNYPHWAQAMRNFLNGRKLWLFVSGDRTKPLQRKGGPTSTPESGTSKANTCSMGMWRAAVELAQYRACGMTHVLGAPLKDTRMATKLLQSFLFHRLKTPPSIAVC
ncbi:hypothetical protein RJ640_024475 [Escallonia rubra]|uniref:Retrotransposon Copia-like N-terminal domain-containing protein n=1 Tax=Escallonia rubra TaxID=112253 RepID=A0AA88R3L1_9ASTE|nr:hypothetical protein RJ640_024475 [Escallonia rubra]